MRRMYLLFLKCSKIIVFVSQGPALHSLYLLWVPSSNGGFSPFIWNSMNPTLCFTATFIVALHLFVFFSRVSYLNKLSFERIRYHHNESNTESVGRATSYIDKLTCNSNILIHTICIIRNAESRPTRCRPAAAAAAAFKVFNILRLLALFVTSVQSLDNSPFRITQGAIHTLLDERCVDIPMSSFSAANTLQIWDCNGGANQQWWRPTSANSLALQTFNNYCMAAYSFDGYGVPVVIYPCNGFGNQQWIFDGRNLRPVFNTNLCLAVSGGTSTNGAQLIVDICDNGVDSAWYDDYSQPNIMTDATIQFAA